MHKKIKELTTKKSYNILSKGLCDDNGNLQLDPDKIVRIWETYVEQLFNDDRPSGYTLSNDDTGPSILKSEVENAIKGLKNNKRPGNDNVYGEVLKMLCETNSQFLDSLVRLFNNIYNSGEFPEDWLESTFVAIPKKPKAKSCDQHRMISLINHISKAYTKVIYNRISKKCEDNIGDSQFGFRNSLGTREALFSLQVLIQRCRDMNKDVYICFIDYAKAFDNVKHEKIIEVLHKIGVDYRDIRTIASLYWGQTAKVKVGSTLTNKIEIKKGVRQGCILSPILFNIYSEEVFKTALEESTEGIKINGEIINNIRYADDTVILASSMEELSCLMSKIQKTSAQYGLRLNITKTKWMLVSKTQQPPQQLILDNERIEHVDSYIYLGTTVNSNWDQAKEIRIRVEKARASFTSMKQIFTSKSLTLPLKIRLLKCYVFPVLLYGMEAWTMTATLMKKVEAFEMWAYRRILRISWTEHVTNEEVLRRIGKEREVGISIKKRKLEYLGHVMRHNKYRVLQLIVQGKIDSRRGPGRRRHSWLQNLRQWFGLSSAELFRSAVNKVRIAMLIANVRNGQGT
jgi:hypothetical protein